MGLSPHTRKLARGGARVGPGRAVNSDAPAPPGGAGAGTLQENLSRDPIPAPLSPDLLWPFDPIKGHRAGSTKSSGAVA